MKQSDIFLFLKINLWLFLFPIFFVLHGYNESFGLISAATLLKLTVRYFLITAIILIVNGILMVNNNFKCYLFSFYCLWVYFFFGAIHDLVKSSTGNSFWSTYKVFLPELLLTSIFALIILNRSRKLPLLYRYSKNLLVVFVFVELVTTTYKLVIGEERNNQLASKLKLDHNIRCLTKKPDIFFVVLDGYTSSMCLKEEFKYDNTEIDSLLSANNFFTSISSASNYNVTPFSLSSTFEMQYLDKCSENEITSSKLFLQAMQTFRSNQLTEFLKEKGYLLENFGCFDLKATPSAFQPYFYGLDYNQIDNQTILSRIDADIGFNWTVKNPFTGRFTLPKNFSQGRQHHILRNQTNLDSLLGALSRPNGNTPRFVYAHLMLPHEPFFLNADGSLVSDTAILLNQLDLKKGYVNQLEYCNSLLRKLIPLASQGPPADRVVIIEGDHGFRFYNDVLKKKEEFRNLNTYFFSDHDYHSLYQGISPVNSFRVVLNKFFCQSLPLLPDTSVFLINDPAFLQ
jgi:hypothetical protein